MALTKQEREWLEQMATRRLVVRVIREKLEGEPLATPAPDETAEALERLRRFDMTDLLDGLTFGGRGLERAVSYGPDDEIEAFKVTGSRRRLAAECVAAVFYKHRVFPLANGCYRLITEPYRQLHNLCPCEPYAEQEAGALASAFLVGPDVLVTAAHVVRTLEDKLFVFGFRARECGQVQVEMPSCDVYEASETIGIHHDTVTKADWAVLRLIRRVPDRDVARIRRTGKIADDAELYVYGHPGGRPLKFADNARVRSNDAEQYFVANLDTGWGSSGSPVFNAATHEVEGLLVRTKPSFKPHNGVGGCQVSDRQLEGGGRGQDVMRVQNFAHLIPE